MKPDIVIIHPGSGNGRRVALVSRVLASMGLAHVVKLPMTGVSRPGRIEANAFAHPLCTTSRFFPRDCKLVIGTARDLSAGKAARIGKKLFLSFDPNRYLKGDTDLPAFFHPILFHPDLVDEHSYEAAGRLAVQSDRRIGILFAGNCDPRIYDNPRMKERFGVVNRIDIQTLARSLPPDQVFMPKHQMDFRERLETDGLKNRLVWIDTKQFRIPQAEWLSFIARSRFFIATPGVQYPYCQNLNEAAACGSVPILQYPHLYAPALEHGNNCLSFEKPENFADAVDQALAMNQSDWLKLSFSTRTYHEDHLSLAALQHRLRTFIDSPDLPLLTWVMAGKET